MLYFDIGLKEYSEKNFAVSHESIYLKFMWSCISILFFFFSTVGHGRFYANNQFWRLDGTAWTYFQGLGS